MTYIAGAKNNKNVFLIADSAITSDKKLTSAANTAFGYPNVESNKKFIQETGLKLFNVKNKAVVAIAGDMQTARDIVNLFYGILGNTKDTKKAFQQAILSCGPYQKNQIGLILGFIDENNSPRLISYKRDKLEEHNSLVQISYLEGTKPMFINLAESIFPEVLRLEIEHEDILATIIGIFNYLGISGELMFDHTGGLFYGIAIEKSGVSWQKDTMFIVYPQEMVNLNYVATFQKNDAIFIFSNFPSDDKRQQKIVLANSMDYNKVNVEELTKELKEQENKFTSGAAQIYTFLSILRNKATILNIKNGQDVFRIKSRGEGELTHFEMALHPNFQTLLTREVFLNNNRKSMCDIHIIQGAKSLDYSIIWDNQ